MPRKPGKRRSLQQRKPNHKKKISKQVKGSPRRKPAKPPTPKQRLFRKCSRLKLSAFTDLKSLKHLDFFKSKFDLTKGTASRIAVLDEILSGKKLLNKLKSEKAQKIIHEASCYLMHQAKEEIRKDTTKFVSDYIKRTNASPGYIFHEPLLQQWIKRHIKIKHCFYLFPNEKAFLKDWVLKSVLSELESNSGKVFNRQKPEK